MRSHHGLLAKMQAVLIWVASPAKCAKAKGGAYAEPSGGQRCVFAHSTGLSCKTRSMGENFMIPAGYMAKRVTNRPEWIKVERVDDIYSVSHCVSDDFADYINYWKHNGYWFFNSPDVIRAIAREHELDLANTTLFYYEVYELEFNDETDSWTPFMPEPSFTTQVVAPASRTLEGFDVVTFMAHTSPECSPLSCNALAADVETNRHCLLSSFRQAKELIELGTFKNSEPGPYRVFAVYTVPWPNA